MQKVVFYWCCKCNLEELNLPSVDYIILHPVKSSVWKKIAKMAVMHLENDSNQTDIHQKSTLSMLLGLKADIGLTMPILRPYKQVSPYQRYAITIKARMLVGVYPVRTRLRQINQKCSGHSMSFLLTERGGYHSLPWQLPWIKTIKDEYRQEITTYWKMLLYMRLPNWMIHMNSLDSHY